MEVPFLDLKTPHRELWPELEPEIKKAFCDAAFIGGPNIQSFETEFAQFCGTAHCASVNSGTDALHLAFRALGIGHGDEVITIPHTFIATTEAISLTGARPVFVDIDPETYTLAPGNIEKAITPRTKAIVPVHLYGQCADMDPILEIASRRNLIVVEDACQAHGAMYKRKAAGSIGRAAAFSFYPGKNLGACGEGGAVVSDDGDICTKVRQLRDHGQARKYYHDCEGVNARMDAIQAICLRAKLRRLRSWNESRIAAAAHYNKRLAGHAGIVAPRCPAHNVHVYHLYVVLVDRRDEVQRKLGEAGVSTGLHYPLPLHLQAAYAALGHKKGDFPVTESVADRLLSLPMFPGITAEQLDYVCEKLLAAVGSA